MSNDSDLIARAERAALDLASTGRNDADAELLNELAKALKGHAGAAIREKRLWQALSWYGENARLCRVFSREGDMARKVLFDDGGRRAREALQGGIHD